MSGLVARQLRQRRSERPKLHKPGLQLVIPGVGHLQGKAQPVDLVGQRPGPGLAVAQYPHLPMESKGLVGQRPAGLPEALRPLLLLVQPLVQPSDLLVPPDHLLVEPGDLFAQRPDGVLLARGSLQGGGAPPTGLHGPWADRALWGLRRRQSLAQPGDFLAQRLDPAALARLDAGFAEERLQARHFRLQGRHVPCRAASFLRLLDGLAQLAPAGFEPRLPRTGITARGHFRPAQLFTTRLRRVRPRPFTFRAGVLLLIPRPPVARLSRRRARPSPAAALGQRQVGTEILVENRHALDDSAWQSALPAPLRDLDSVGMMIPMSPIPRLHRTLTPHSCGTCQRDPNPSWNGNRPTSKTRVSWSVFVGVASPTICGGIVLMYCLTWFYHRYAARCRCLCSPCTRYTTRDPFARLTGSSFHASFLACIISPVTSSEPLRGMAPTVFASGWNGHRYFGNRGCIR